MRAEIAHFSHSVDVWNIVAFVTALHFHCCWWSRCAAARRSIIFYSYLLRCAACAVTLFFLRGVAARIGRCCAPAFLATSCHSLCLLFWAVRALTCTLAGLHCTCFHRTPVAQIMPSLPARASLSARADFAVSRFCVFLPCTHCTRARSLILRLRVALHASSLRLLHACVRVTAHASCVAARALLNRTASPPRTGLAHISCLCSRQRERERRKEEEGMAYLQPI